MQKLKPHLVLRIGMPIIFLLTPFFMPLPNASIWVWAISSTITRGTPMFAVPCMSPKSLNSSVIGTYAGQIIVIILVWTTTALITANLVDEILVSNVSGQFRSLTDCCSHGLSSPVFQSQYRFLRFQGGFSPKSQDRLDGFMFNNRKERDQVLLRYRSTSRRKFLVALIDVSFRPLPRSMAILLFLRS